MIVREATIADAPKIAGIHAASWRDTYKNELNEKYLAELVSNEREEMWKSRFINPVPNQYVAIAEIDGETVGFACFYSGENPDFGSYLDNLHVSKNHHSKGIGKSLLLNGARWCFEQQPDEGLCLLVSQSNTHAQAFYKRLGTRNCKDGVWNAPDGSVVPTFWYVWDDIKPLIENQ